MEKPQSATFTVTADTPQELARMLRRIADALDGGPGPAGTPAEPPSPPRSPGSRTSTLPWLTSRWDEDAVRDLWDRLETPGARHAIRYLAERGERTRVDELADALGKAPGPALAGTLSPIGRAVSAMGAEPPFRRVRSHYEVDDDFVRAWRTLMTELAKDSTSDEG